MEQPNPHSSSDTWRQWITFLAIAAAFGINILSNLVPPTGANIGAIANTLFRDVQIIPANYAFAIWGVIYIGLFAYGIYQLQANQRTNPLLRGTGYLLAIACLAQIIWVFLFLYRYFALSILAMLGILIPLMLIFVRVHQFPRSLSRSERWYVQIPMGIYMGWISVATVVNVASALDAADWNGWGLSAAGWTIIMMLVAVAIALIIALRYRDLAFPGVMIWALVAIAVKPQNTAVVDTVAVVLAIALSILLLIQHTRFRPHQAS